MSRKGLLLLAVFSTCVVGRLLSQGVPPFPGGGDRSAPKVESIPNRDLPPRLARLVANASAELKLVDGHEPDGHLERLESNARLAEATAKVQKLELESLRLKSRMQELQLDTAKIALNNAPDRANVLRSSVWPAGPIEVHWENPTPANAQERQWVRDAIERTWERNSGLRFVGWDTATPTSRGIRIQINEEGPHCKRLGRYLDGVTNGMVLNFTFQTWCPACTTDRRGSIEKIAVHEFGHAVGFAHEQNRADAPEWCQRERQGTDGDWYITIYDPNSIMNYCNPRWNNDGLLSPLDLEAVQSLYGRPTPAPAAPPAPASPPKPMPNDRK